MCTLLLPLTGSRNCIICRVHSLSGITDCCFLGSILAHRLTSASYSALPHWQMGVPGFYRWACQRVPKLKARKHEKADFYEFDNVYLDFNGVVHSCCQHWPSGTAVAVLFDLIEEELALLIGLGWNICRCFWFQHLRVGVALSEHHHHLASP